MPNKLSRRDFLRAGALTVLGASGAASLSQFSRPAQAAPPGQMDHPSAALQPHDRQIDHTTAAHAMPMPVGEVDHARNGFNPTEILTDFETGVTSALPSGQTLREFDIYAINQEVEIAPGIFYPAWTYNGRIPGPTLRCTEGEQHELEQQ